jgi:S-adenosylmethionine hydrolase
MAGPAIVFLTDYGLQDEFVGTCHAVIARLCPSAHVIDLTHGIPRHDVHTGAVILRNSLPYLPDGVVVGVVDPEVGTERRAVALRTASGRLMVGPDNGLLAPAAARDGGVTELVEIGRSPFRLEPVAATFHGRDVFAPVAAALAAGEPLEAVGEPLEAGTLVPLRLPRAVVRADGVAAHVLHSDRFGNAILDALPGQLEQAGIGGGAALAIRPLASGPLAHEDRQAHEARYGATFSDVEEGGLVVYVDGLGMLAVAVNGGSAMERLGLGRDDELLLARA